MTRRTVFAVVLTALVGASAQASVESFEGKWRVDKKKTQATGAPEDLECEIKKDGAGLVIKSRYREPKSAVYPLMWVGIMTYELPLSTDGSEKVNHIGPFAHASKTRIEGNKMITDWRATMENGHVEGKWIRTLSDDGREMTLQIISKASDGRNMDQTLVMRRR